MRAACSRGVLCHVIRFFAEECDALGGFQLLAHDAGGFGGLAEGLLTHIRDDYARTPVVRAAMSAPALQQRR